MTVTELREALAAMPADAAVCFAQGEVISEIGQAELVQVVFDGKHFSATFDSADDEAIRVVCLM